MQMKKLEVTLPGFVLAMETAPLGGGVQLSGLFHDRWAETPFAGQPVLPE